MKYMIINLALLLLFAGCADKNAFSRFHMKEEQELGAVNLQNSELKNSDGDIKGIISVVYLNNVYPKKYVDYEYFYIYFYLNDKKDIQNINFMLKLNNKLPISVKELSNTNEFSKLTSTQNRWNKYYLVKFNEDKNTTIKFEMTDEDLSSNPMFYYKDEE